MGPIRSPENPNPFHTPHAQAPVPQVDPQLEQFRKELHVEPVPEVPKVGDERIGFNELELDASD